MCANALRFATVRLKRKTGVEINCELMGRKFVGVLLLLKIRRNLLESKPFKTSWEFIFFQIRSDFFLRKSFNFD